MVEWLKTVANEFRMAVLRETLLHSCKGLER